MDFSFSIFKSGKLFNHLVNKGEYFNRGKEDLKIFNNYIYNRIRTLTHKNGSWYLVEFYTLEKSFYNLI